MLTALQVLKEARALGSTATLAQCQAALAAIDRTPYEQSERARYAVTLWDGVNPINGVSAQTIFATRNDIPKEVVENPDGTITNVLTGDVVLISVDGGIVYFQPHDPNQIGFAPIAKGAGIAFGNAMIDKIIEPAVDAKVLEVCLMQLL